LSEDGEKTAKPGLLRRLLGGAGQPAPEVEPAPATPPAEEPFPEPESPAAAGRSPEPEPPPAADEASPEPEPPPSFIRRLFGGAAAPSTPEEALAAEALPVNEAPPPIEVTPPAPKRTWFQRLRSGLSLSSNSIGRGITDIFTKRKLDAESLDDLEDILIQADLGLPAATRIREAIGRGRFEKGIDADAVRAVLADEVERALAPVARPLVIDPSKRPFVILVVGVNGSGKTTTIGKLAAQLRGEGKTIVLAAGDTFRAAAIEQARVWARRTGSDLVEREQGADAAGLAFDALTRARELNADVVLMDTAGRLQNRAELMGELEKIIRVMKKVEPEAPHAVLLVLDATVGQNALNQVEIFGRTAGVTGLVMTKLDGTARGGILVAIADKFTLPVHYIGVGEGVDDLEPFAARDFAEAIAGLDHTGTDR
jgi:fused signal recognition particle receptor